MTTEGRQVMRLHYPSGMKCARTPIAFRVELVRPETRRQVYRMYRDMRADGLERFHARYYVIMAAAVLQ